MSPLLLLAGPFAAIIVVGTVAALLNDAVERWLEQDGASGGIRRRRPGRPSMGCAVRPAAAAPGGQDGRIAAATPLQGAPERSRSGARALRRREPVAVPAERRFDPTRRSGPSS